MDFMIMEAVAIKVAREDAEAAKKSKSEEWKHDKEGLDKLRGLA